MMKSINKFLTILAVSAGLSLVSCDIDPVLTDSYPEDVAWSFEWILFAYWWILRE